MSLNCVKIGQFGKFKQDYKMMHATSDSSGDVGADDEQQHNKPMSQNSALNGIKHDETTDLEDEFTLEHFRHLERTSVAQNFSAVLNDPRVSVRYIVLAYLPHRPHLRFSTHFLEKRYQQKM
jgi:hypothetical protein